MVSFKNQDEKYDVMQWKTQGGTLLQLIRGFRLISNYQISEQRIVMCECRTYELAEIRYGMILSRYLLTPVEFFSFFVNIDEIDEGLWSTWVHIILNI